MQQADWGEASRWSPPYWNHISDDPVLSEEFHILCRAHAVAVQPLRHRLLG